MAPTPATRKDAIGAHKEKRHREEGQVPVAAHKVRLEVAVGCIMTSCRRQWSLLICASLKQARGM